MIILNRRNFLISTTGLLSVAACVQILRPRQREPYSTSPISDEEHARTLFHMRPPKRRRPVIVVFADNQGSETTDFIIPWSVLTRSGVADVYAVGLDSGPINLMPALTIVPQMTTHQFSQQFPEGADYVIVPALHNPKSPNALAWIQQQRTSNATLIGICAGALPLAYAGLLEGKRATTHWFSIKKLMRVSPSTLWINDRRFVADNGIITSTGVSASLPLSLSLVEAIAGREASDELAAGLGVSRYDEQHDSDYFELRPSTVYRVVSNSVSIFGHEKIALSITNGVDELSLSFTADAWSRTYRSKAFTVSGTERVMSLNGLEIIPDFMTGSEQKFETYAPIPESPGNSLSSTLAQIEGRYGASTASNVALQLEYPWQE